MPDRYTIAHTSEELEEYFQIKVAESYKPRYNAAPAQLLPVITSQSPDGLSFFFWGTIPDWAGNKAISRKITTVSSELLETKPIYKKLLQTNRCLIPADGFYFWKKVGKRTRIPNRAELTDRSVSAFAGIWEEFSDENEQVHHVFRIITVPSEGEDLDETRPVFLSLENGRKWLSTDTEESELLELLKIAPDLFVYTVTSKIENIELDKSSLLNQVDSMNQHGNYSLFD